MKNLIYSVIFFSLVSCNNDDLLNFYASQNRSVEFFGKWKQIEISQDMFLEFTEEELTMASDLNDVHNTKYKWYNDDYRFYFIANGKGSKNDANTSVYYSFNVSKDTLKISFGGNVWETFVKTTN